MNDNKVQQIRVLVVDDSAVVRQLLVQILTSDEQLQVVATAADAEQALAHVRHHKPDVITMDIHMPGLNGWQATRQIMEICPTPVVIVSGSTLVEESSLAFRTLEAGALAVLSRPPGPGHPEFEKASRELIQTVKLMAEVRVVRRWPSKNRELPVPPPKPAISRAPSDIRLVAMGASTGGPLALVTILQRLPKPFPVPVLIVQHISTGFIEGFVRWLRSASGFPVKVAVAGEVPLPGQAYIAPDGVHMRMDSHGLIALSSGGLENGLCPSVSVLFRSVAEVLGKHAVGVLLTGMGKDGAEGLRQMKDAGALTLAQDKESSVVYGMPAEAVRLGAATYSLSPEQISETLAKLVR